jgi:hypothetical protein
MSDALKIDRTAGAEPVSETLAIEKLELRAHDAEDLMNVAEELRCGQLTVCKLLTLIEAGCDLKPEELLPVLVAMNRAERTIDRALGEDEAATEASAGS